MIPAYFLSAIIYANLLMLLSIGFTFAYMTAKVPNFAHGAIAGVGIYTCLTVVRILDLSPYLSVPIAFLVCGLVSALIYRGVIQTLKKRGESLILLSIATVALEIMIFAAINIYADYLRGIVGMYARVFLFRDRDVTILEVPGVFFVSTVLTIGMVATLHLVLTKTKFGIATRAVVENADLAVTLGIDAERVSLVSWFVTGGLAGVAGSLLPLWFQSLPATGSGLMTSVFSASVVGGLSSIYGAMLGGYIIGLTEILGTIFLMDVFGLWIAPYRPLVPLIAMFIILLGATQGIAGVVEKVQANRIKRVAAGSSTFARRGTNV